MPQNSTSTFVLRPNPVLCRIWGHKLDADASYYHGVDYCERCVQEVCDAGTREWMKTKLWILRCRIADALKPIVRFFRRCPDCQNRFNRCDESVDHLPF